LRDLCAQSYQQGAPQSSQLALSTAGALGVFLPEAQQVELLITSIYDVIVYYTSYTQVIFISPLSVPAAAVSALSRPPRGVPQSESTGADLPPVPRLLPQQPQEPADQDPAGAQVSWGPLGAVGWPGGPLGAVGWPGGP